MIATFPHDSNIMTAACAAVRNIAASPALRAALLAGGADALAVPVIAALTSALAAECGEAGAAADAAGASGKGALAQAHAAAGALFGLACEPANCPALYGAGAARAAIAALQSEACRGDSFLAWASCGVLLKLAAADELLEPLQQGDDAGAVLLLAISNHSSDVRVVRAACGGLRRLPGSCSNRAMLQSSGVAAAVDAMEREVRLHRIAAGAAGAGSPDDRDAAAAVEKAKVLAAASEALGRPL